MTETPSANGDQTATADKKADRKKVLTDPTLLLAAKLDRLLAESPKWVRTWALAWLSDKYMGPNNPADGKPFGDGGVI